MAKHLMLLGTLVVFITTLSSGVSADVYSDRATRCDEALAAESYIGDGPLTWAKGDVDKAAADYGEATRLNPRLAEAVFTRGGDDTCT